MTDLSAAGSSRSLRRTLLASSILGAVIPGVALAGPVGGNVAAGSADIASSASTTTINQSSMRAVLDWQSFSVDQDEAVVFNQPSAQAATLNRVTGGTGSTIAGRLTSNGAVYLVNPNGIAITASGNVQTGGGFVASTLDIADADFMAGRLKFVGNGSSGLVSNGGSISAGQGAYVALLGGQVANSGTIRVPLGKVALASGEQVALDINGGQFLQVAVPSSVVTGSNALVDNAGEIIVQGGSVVLKAAVLKDAIRNVINMSGTINADSATGDGGTIELIGGSDTEHMAGTVSATGSLSARATGASGNGGFIETSGATVEFGGAAVDASSANGEAGTWLIDPTNLTVSTTTQANTIASSLDTGQNGTNVTLQTTATTASGTGTQSTGPGDIIIDQAISWTKRSNLTLSAYNNVQINANITSSSTGTGDLVLIAGGSTGTGTQIYGAGNIAMAGGTITATINNTGGTAALSGNVTGAGNFTKTGVGTLTLSGANTLSGTTQFNGGTTALTGSWNFGASNHTFTTATGATFSGTGVITAATATFSGAGIVSLTGNNSITTVSGGVSAIGALTLVNSKSLALNTIAASGKLDLRAIGSTSDLIINASQSITSSASGTAAVVLSAGRNFVNNSSSTAVVANGTGSTWQIYSVGKAGNTFGSLNSGNTAIWNTSLTATSSVLTASGNRYIFATAPTLTVSIGADLSKVYGSSGASALAGATVTVSGFQSGVANAYLGDSQATALSGTASLASTGSAAAAHVGAYGITLSGLTALNGYTLDSAISNKLNVTQRDLQITYTANFAQRTYGAANPVLGGRYVASGLVNGDVLATILGGAATWTTGAVGNTGVGKHAVTGGGLTSISADYTIMPLQAAFNATALTIAKAPLTVTFKADPASRTYGSLNPALTGTYQVSGLQNGESESDALTGSKLFFATATSTTGVGSYAITGTGFAATANYSLVRAQDPGNTTALTITPAPLTITYTANGGSRTYGASNPIFSGTYAVAGYKNGDTGGVEATGMTFSTTTDQNANVGKYAINGGGVIVTNNNYVFKPAVQAASNAKALTVNPAVLTLTYNPTPISRTYGAYVAIGGSHVVTGAVLGQDGESMITGAQRFATTATLASGVGSYDIVGSGLTLASTNYTLNVVQNGRNALTVTPAPLTVTYTANGASRTYGAVNPSFSGTYAVTGYKNGDTGDINDTSLVFGSLATETSSVGRYAINGSGVISTNANYFINPVQYWANATALAINPAVLTITYTANPVTRAFHTNNPVLTGQTPTVAGFQNGDTQASVIGGIVAWKTSANWGTAPGSYEINGSGLKSLTGNYIVSVQQASANASALTITP